MKNQSDRYSFFNRYGQAARQGHARAQHNLAFCKNFIYMYIDIYL